MCECGPYVGLDVLAVIILIHASYEVPLLVFLIRHGRKEKSLRGIKGGKLIDKLGLKLGRFFSNFRAIIWVLLFYVVISVATFFALACKLYPNYSKAAFIAFEIATGGDPFNFSNDLNKFTYLWLWVLFLHLISWLLVPVLTATAIDAAYRIWEQRRMVLERTLKDKMKEVLNLQSTLPPEEIEQIVQDVLDEVTREIKTH